MTRYWPEQVKHPSEQESQVLNNNSGTGPLSYDRDVVNYVNSNKPLINFNDLYEEEIKEAERKL